MDISWFGVPFAVNSIEEINLCEQPIYSDNNFAFELKPDSIFRWNPPSTRGCFYFILSCGCLQRCHLKCADWLCNLHYRIYRTISYTFIFQIYIQAIFSFLSNINANINKEIGSDNVERRHYNQSLFRFLSTTISAESLLSPRSEPRYIITGKWILSRR